MLYFKIHVFFGKEITKNTCFSKMCMLKHGLWNILYSLDNIPNTPLTFHRNRSRIINPWNNHAPQISPLLFDYSHPESFTPRIFYLRHLFSCYAHDFVSVSVAFLVNVDVKDFSQLRICRPPPPSPPPKRPYLHDRSPQC